MNIIVALFYPLFIKYSQHTNLKNIQSEDRGMAVISLNSFVNSLISSAVTGSFLLLWYRGALNNPRKIAVYTAGLFVANFLLTTLNDWRMNRQEKNQQNQQINYLTKNGNGTEMWKDLAQLEKLARSFLDMAHTLKVVSYNPSSRFNLGEVCQQLKSFHSLLVLILLDLGIPIEKANQILGPLFNQIQMILSPPKPLDQGHSLTMKGFFAHDRPDTPLIHSTDDEEYYSPEEEEKEERDEKEEVLYNEETPLSNKKNKSSLIFSPSSIVSKEDLEFAEQSIESNLEEEGFGILRSKGIHVYKPDRHVMAGCASEEMFRVHSYWIRYSFSQLIRDEHLRREFSEAGKNLTVMLLQVVGGNVEEFQQAYDNFLMFLKTNIDDAVRDAEKLPVRYLNIWDLFFEYTLIDAFEALESIPGSLTSMLQWTPQSAKLTLVQKFISSNLDEKIRQAQQDNNQFREKYLMALKVRLCFCFLFF